jgi:hypothetical protein
MAAWMSSGVISSASAAMAAASSSAEVQHFFVHRLGLRHAGEGFDQILLQIAELQGFFRDFAQRHHRVLVIVTVDGQLLAAADIAGALGGQQHQLKPVGNFENAIFNGDAGHHSLQANF